MSEKKKRRKKIKFSCYSIIGPTRCDFYFSSLRHCINWLNSDGRKIAYSEFDGKAASPSYSNVIRKTFLNVKSSGHILFFILKDGSRYEIRRSLKFTIKDFKSEK